MGEGGDDWARSAGLYVVGPGPVVLTGAGGFASWSDLGGPCATGRNRSYDSGLIVFFTGSTSERRRAGQQGALPVPPSQLTVAAVALVTVTMVVIVNMVRWVDPYDARADTGVSGAVLCRIEASPGVPVRGSTKVGRLERGPGLTPFSGPFWLRCTRVNQ